MGLIKGEPNTDIAASGGRWWLPLALLIAAMILLFGGDTAREWLRFERAGIADGEIWRLFTGHLAHLGWSHFVLDAVGLGLVWYLVGASLRFRDWAIVATASVCAIDLGLWLGSPELQWYVGLSGLVHGILAAGVIAAFGQQRFEMLALGLLLVIKLTWEQIYGPMPGSESSSGGPVVVAAHLYGALGGGLAVILIRLIRVRLAARI